MPLLLELLMEDELYSESNILLSLQLVSELKEQNSLLKTEKEELNRRIHDQAREITGWLSSLHSGSLLHVTWLSNTLLHGLG